MTTDFHGHSRKKNVFMYGCNINPGDPTYHVSTSIIHQLPETIATQCPIFGVKDCKYAIEKEKETTARIVLFKEYSILNSYTLETTFFGSEFFKKANKLFRRSIDPRN